MNFTYVEFPCSADLNAFKAYFNLNKTILPKIHGKSLQLGLNSDTSDVNINSRLPSLRHLVLDAIIENWNENPIFDILTRQEDRNYILSNLNVNLPLKLLSSHIRDDFFWRKSYQQRWKTGYHHTIELEQQQQQQKHSLAKCKPVNAKPWINIYMERHLQEFIENVETCDYDLESVQAILDICAAYINQLEINFLQPAVTAAEATRGVISNEVLSRILANYETLTEFEYILIGRTNDILGFFVYCANHIPLDFILSNLPELHTLRLTYCTKTLDTNYYLGCNMLSQNDTLHLARGLNCCYEMQHFCLHSTKLEPYQMRFFARSLDKGCHKLHSLDFVHCSIGDAGIRQFIVSCNKESFATLKVLDLTNNNITSDGAYVLSRALRRLSLERLVLRLNPIQSDGAAAIISVLNYLPLKYFDISGCSLCEAITKLFMQLIIQNKTILHLDISNNELGEDFAKHLYKIIGFNKILQNIDLRNTGLTVEMRNKFKNILQENIPKVKHKL